MSIGTHEHTVRVVGDIGGTHIRFAVSRGVQDISRIWVKRTVDYHDLETPLREFLSQEGLEGIKTAVIGIANPVSGDHISMTNAQWSFSTEATRKALKLERLVLLNDFSALALALPHLPSDELELIGSGQPVRGTPIGLLGPGTGLGVSGLIPTSEGKWVALAGEGGHTSFSPCDETETWLWEQAREIYGHVSTERFLSGAGLQLIYQCLTRQEGQPQEDLAPWDITARALEQSCSLSLRTLDIFCAILGTAAANLALTLGARGGIFLGGGIVPKLGEYFSRSPFHARFRDKGRFGDYLAAIPVHVIRSPYPGLVGAAAHLVPQGGLT
ncbi:glucokinase [Achromobacter sp. F4_2707]|uniref:glucokinase n=1 Tax=Achromobacter sp. F4_2707 TaxID=3114286 RepID=UPI0039C7567F